MYIRESQVLDIAYLKTRLRQSDVDEIWASNNLTPTDALTFSYYLSKVCMTVVDENPVGMFGIVEDPENSQRALIWMLGTDGLSKVAKKLFKETKEFIEGFLDAYPLLYNFIDAENTRSIAWLRKLGAEIGEARPHGKEGKLFCYFSFRRHLIHA